MDIKHYMQDLGQRARRASRIIAAASSQVKNQALLEIATLIDANQDALIAANSEDVQQARANGMDAALLDRLTLSRKAIETMIAGLQQIAALPDPVGEMSNCASRVVMPVFCAVVRKQYTATAP